MRRRRRSGIASGRRRAGDLSGRAGDVAATAALVDLAALAAAADYLVLVPALADAAEMAMYWQEPDPVDWTLRDHQVQENTTTTQRR
jgi:hypothetical protein